MLELGVIEPYVSPWSTSPVLVVKKDGTPRFCMDYCQLNSILLQDSFPLPCLDDIFSALGEFTIFSSMDF